MRLFAVALAAAILPAGVLAGEEPTATMTVFLKAAQVEERKEVDKATEKAMKETRKQAEEARKKLEKELKAQYGKKKEEWPPEVQERYYDAEEAEAVARAAFEYRKVDPKGIADSLEDLGNSIRGEGLSGVKRRVVLVDAIEEAQLVVEVRARRSTKDFGAVVPSNCYTLFAIEPGPRLDAGRFEKLPTNYRPKKFGLYVWRISAPSAAEPGFVFESYNGGGTPFGCHGAAANEASGGIDKFIEDNHAALTGS